jgi:thiol-disulfide isomerase/thioredoxin
LTGAEQRFVRPDDTIEPMRSIHRTACVLLVIALAGCESREAERPPAAPRAPGIAPAVVSVTPLEIQKLATRGGARATLVNVWATWCVPCREEFPALLRVANARAHDGVRLVLISADFPDQMPAVRDFLVAHSVTDTSYLKSGDDMSFINALSPKWSGALPATFIYTSDGRLATFWEGMADSSRFETALNQALASHPSTEVARP